MIVSPLVKSSMISDQIRFLTSGAAGIAGNRPSPARNRPIMPVAKNASPSLQIYATFHRDFPFNPHCDWIVPVASAQYSAANMPARDDTGYNIAHLNPYYCEITTHYWVWKN